MRLLSFTVVVAMVVLTVTPAAMAQSSNCMRYPMPPESASTTEAIRMLKFRLACLQGREVPRPLSGPSYSNKRLLTPSVPTYTSDENSGFSNRIQDSGIYTYSNGLSGTSTRIGNFEFHNYSNGVSGTSSRIGNFEFHNYSNGVSGTSTRFGNSEFHNYSNGVSGTSSRIGNFEFHNFSDGTNCTTTYIGSQSFTNCY